MERGGGADLLPPSVEEEVGDGEEEMKKRALVMWEWVSWFGLGSGCLRDSPA